MATTSATTGSNIDVASIVSQLMTVEQRPLTVLAQKEASYQAKLSAYGTLQGALSNFQSAVSGLSDVTKFQSLTATPADSSLLTASADRTASAGTYAIDITSLAQPQKLVALGQASQTAGIGAGGATTLTFDFGTIAGGTLASGTYTGSTFTSNGNGTKTVSIDATNNSLQGIRDAINSANIGVTAAIINDGSATPYRLSLAPSANGSSNSVKISVAGDAALSTLLAHDPGSNSGQNLTETAAAQNANFTINGVAVSKASNSVSDVIQGVTLNLQKITTSTTNLNIANNTSSVNSAVASLVKAYNDLNTTVKNVSGYNAATKQGAILQGDSTVRSLQTQVHAVLNKSISGGGALTTLGQIGVTFQKDGSLALDSTKLGTVISNNFSDIAALFATVGKASDSLIGYSSAATTVQPGSYAVNISQLATKGNIVGSAPAGTLIIAAGSNDALNVAVNGVSTAVTLAAGTYTAATLAAEVQAKINGSSPLSSVGSTVTVSQSAGVFTFTSNSYGSTSTVAVTGSGASNLLGGAPTMNAGLDVAGTIDSLAATGAGQYLSAGGGNALGLKLQVNGGALGARGSVNYSHGYAYALANLADSLLGSNGLLTGKTTGINKSIADIGKQRDAVNVHLAAIQKRYTAQFSALDVMLSNMNQTSTYLTQQLANLPKPY